MASRGTPETVNETQLKMRYAYIKPNNVVEEFKRVRMQWDLRLEGGPEAYVAHFLRTVENNPALLISTHFHPSTHDECICEGRIVAKSYYWYSKFLQPFGRIARKPIGTFATRFIGSWRILFCLLRFRPDRILCWATSLPLWATYAASRVRSTPFVYCRHNRVLFDGQPWYQQISGAVDRWIMRRADAIIVHGPYLRQQMLDLGIEPKKIVEFNWNFAHLFEKSSIDRFKNNLYLPSSEVTVVLYIGRIQRSKGVFDLLEAMTPLLSQDQGLRLVYAGDGIDLDQMERRIDELALGMKVQLIGRVPHHGLAQLISGSRFVVTPTQTRFPEGRCMAAMEGLIMKKPVIAPNFGPFPYLVRDGKNGLLYEPDSISSLRDSIDHLLRDQALYRTVCGGAAETSEELQKPSVNFSQAMKNAFDVACSNL